MRPSLPFFYFPHVGVSSIVLLAFFGGNDRFDLLLVRGQFP